MINSIRNAEVLRYIIIGVGNLILSFLIFAVLLRLFNLNHTISLVISFVCGLFYSYVFNYLWVFNVGRNLQFNKIFIQHSLIVIATFSLNACMLNFFVSRFEVDPILIQLMLMPFFVVANYLFTKFYIMKKRNDYE